MKPAALFLDRDNRIVAVHRAIPPNRITRIYPTARSVLELPAGTVGPSDAITGETVEFI